MGNQAVKGLMFTSVLKVIRADYGDEVYERVVSHLPHRQYSSFKSYPVEEDLLFEKVLCEELYGVEDGPAHVKLGGIFFKAISNSVVAKSVFALGNNDIKRVCKYLTELNNAFLGGMEWLYADLGPNEIEITMTNSPYWPEQYQGLIRAAGVYFGKDPVVTCTVPQKDTIVVHAQWE